MESEQRVPPADVTSVPPPAAGSVPPLTAPAASLPALSLRSGAPVAMRSVSPSSSVASASPYDDGGRTVRLRSGETASKSVAAVKFEEVNAFAAAAYHTPYTHAAHQATVLAMVHRWGTLAPERAPAAPILVAGAQRPAPARINPEQGWRVRTADIQTVMSGVTESQTAGDLYVASSKVWSHAAVDMALESVSSRPAHHSAPPSPRGAAVCTGNAASAGVAATPAQSIAARPPTDAVQVAETQLVHEAAAAMAKALQDEVDVELIGGRGFLTDPALDAAELPSGTYALLCNDPLMGAQETMTATLKGKRRGAGAHMSVLAVFDAAAAVDEPDAAPVVSSHIMSPSVVGDEQAVDAEHVGAEVLDSPAFRVRSKSGALPDDAGFALTPAADAGLLSPTSQARADVEAVMPQLTNLMRDVSLESVGPRSVAVLPHAGAEHGVAVLRIVGEAVAACSVGHAYADALSTAPGSTHDYSAHLIQQSTVFELHGANPEQAAAFATCHRRATQAKACGLAFRRGAPEDVMAVAQIMSPFNPTHDDPDGKRARMIAGVRHMIEAGDCFVLTVPDQWLAHTLGVSKKARVEREEAARASRRAKLAQATALAGAEVAATGETAAADVAPDGVEPSGNLAGGATPAVLPPPQLDVSTPVVAAGGAAASTAAAAAAVASPSGRASRAGSVTDLSNVRGPGVGAVLSPSVQLASHAPDMPALDVEPHPAIDIIVGFVQLTDRNPCGARITRVAVSKQYRHRDFAQLMLHMLVDELMLSEGLPSICSYVPEGSGKGSSPAAVLQRAGFVPLSSPHCVVEIKKGKAHGGRGKKVCVIQ